MSVLSSSLKNHQITPDSYRFINLTLLMLGGLINGIPCQAFAGISPIISEIYELSSLQANANSLFYPIMYVIMILPANYVIDQKGLKIGTLICQSLMCIGLTLRCLINLHFYFFLAGTFICSLGFCFIISAVNRFPHIWFLENEILIVKSLLLFCIFASDTVGFFMPTAVISKSSCKNDVQRFFMIQGGVLILFHILGAVFFRDLPKNPQNYSSQVEKQEYLKNLKKLVHHKNYRKLFCSVTCVYSMLSLIFVGIAWVGDAYGVSTQQCGYILIIANAAGLIGCAFSGILFKDQYKLKCKIFLVGTFLSLFLMFTGFETDSFWLIGISAALVGVNIFPFLTTVLDLGSQTTFPIGEGTSGGSILFGGQTFGFLLIVLFSIYINNDITIQKGRITQGVLLVLIILGYLFLHISEEDLKRKKYEEKIKVQEKASLIEQSLSYQVD